MTLAELYIAPHYANGAALYGARFFPKPIYLEDLLEGPNAWSSTLLPPTFAWRVGYPSPAMDEPLRSNEIRRSAAHEIGHGFELVCIALGIDIHRLYWEFRRFSGSWDEWLAAGHQPRESFADCFAAALLGVWLVPSGSSQADRYWNENKTVTAAEARDFFMRVTSATAQPGGTPTMTVIQLPSPNFGSNGIRGVHGRTQPIRYIVLHTTEGTDSRSWLTNPASVVSATYLIREEAIYQLVDENDVAWHAGRIVGIPTTTLYTGINPNEESIGIEIEGFAGQTISAAKMALVLELINDIRARRGDLPRVGHFELSPGDRSDPGLPNFSAIQNALGGWLDVDETTLRRIIREEATSPLSSKIDSGINTTIAVMLRRTARWIRLGIGRDPAGDSSVTPPKGYTDDFTPLG